MISPWRYTCYQASPVQSGAVFQNLELHFQHHFIAYQSIKFDFHTYIRQTKIP